MRRIFAAKSDLKISILLRYSIVKKRTVIILAVKLLFSSYGIALIADQLIVG